MASRNRNNKKSQNGASKQPVAPALPEDPSIEGRLIDVQVWKTISKGKVKGTSVDIPEAATATEEKVPEAPRKPSKTIPISRGQLGKLIGPKGTTIKKFEEHFSVQISQPQSEPGEPETAQTKVTVEGDDREHVQNAVTAIRQFLITSVAPWSEHQLVTESVDVPKRSVREILGDQGKIKALIGKASRTQIVVPLVNDNDVNGSATIKITGAKAEDLAKAKDIIEEIVLFHCHPITHPELTYMQMDVPQKYHGRILGSRGAHAARLEHEYKVRVFMPSQQQPNLVVVGDNEENVIRCMDAIEDIMDDTDKKDVARAEADAAKAAKKAAKEEAKAAAAAAAAAAAETAENSADSII
jgi:rRNA processing protein Krr1/Pno1